MKPNTSNPIAILLHNKQLKLLALLLALISWFFIQQTINFEAVVDEVPLKVLVDHGWAVLEMSTDTVDIHFRGSQEDLVKLRREYIEVEVDVRGLEGSTTVQLSPDLVKAPAGVRTAYLQPDILEVSLDREVQKQVPVKVEVPEMPDGGLVLEKVVCVPASVLVSGPRKRLQDIEMVRTEPITLDGRTGSFRERVAIVAPSKTWQAKVLPEKVNVEVSLGMSADHKTFDEVEVTALLDSGRPVEFSIKPLAVKVEISGRTELLQEIEAGDLKAFVDCSELDVSAKYDLPIRVSPPAGTVMTRVEPDSVSVQIEFE